MKNHRTQEELTGLTSNEHKFRFELIFLRGFYLQHQEAIEKAIENQKNMSDWERMRQQRIREDHPEKNSLPQDKNRIAINRHDLRLLERRAYSEAVGKIGKILSRTQLYERMDNLEAIGCLNQNPDSHITVNGNILPDNNTRYYINIDKINYFLENLEIKLHSVGNTIHPHPNQTNLSLFNNTSNNNNKLTSASDERAIN